jgi:hypothetical protein
VQADANVRGPIEGVDGLGDVKIAVGYQRTLYYFSVKVDNGGLKPNGFAAFCELLGPGDAFIKSKSYLMHHDRFSDLRNFCLS